VQPWDDGPQTDNDQVNGHGIVQEPRTYKDENAKKKGDDAPYEANWLKHESCLSTSGMSAMLTAPGYGNKDKHAFRCVSVRWRTLAHSDTACAIEHICGAFHEYLPLIRFSQANLGEGSIL
jgi:hypothetical protein